MLAELPVAEAAEVESRRKPDSFPLPVLGQRPRTISRISPAELAAKLMAAERVRLLDARTDEEWIAARIRGALHLDNRRVEGILQSWPRQLPLIIYCHLGEQAPKAAEFFISHGFTNVRWLSGGIDAWSREIDPSVRRYRLEYPPAPTEAKQTP